MKEKWCVEHRDGWCVTAHQPKGEPRYRDQVKTKCGYWVTLPWGFMKTKPTCNECKD
jgi:hypothetical protein